MWWCQWWRGSGDGSSGLRERDVYYYKTSALLNLTIYMRAREDNKENSNLVKKKKGISFCVWV